MARTDTHSPKKINPANYRYVTAFYSGSSAAYETAYRNENEAWTKALDAHPMFAGNFTAKRTCDHCGAIFSHGVCYLHVPSQRLVHVGHVCAENTMLPNVDEAARARIRAERIAKAVKTQIDNEEYRLGVLANNPELVPALELDHYIVQDIRRRFDGPKPSISDKQIALVLKIAREEAARVVQQAEEMLQPKVPVPVGKGIEIEGTIVSTKWVDNDYGGSVKMLVKDDRGFKVYGTMPKALDATFNERNEHVAAGRGDRIKFSATVEASRDDVAFGFFKYPRKAERLVAV